MIKNIICFLLSMALLFSCAKISLNNTDNQQVIVKEILFDQYKGLKKPNNILITNSKDFNSALKRRNIEDFNPKVNFKQNSIIIIDSGEKSNGGYGITLKQHHFENDTLFLNTQTTSPSKNQAVTMALTKPLVIYKVNHPNIKNLIIENN